MSPGRIAHLMAPGGCRGTGAAVARRWAASQKPKRHDRFIPLSAQMGRLADARASLARALDLDPRHETAAELIGALDAALAERSR